MNKVFKTVWNASLGVWVAVSEMASGRTKSSSSKIKKSIVNTVATVAIGAAAQASMAGWAPTQIEGDDLSKLLGEYGTEAIAIGANTTDAKAMATGNRSVAIGKSAKATAIDTVALGAGAQSIGPRSSSIGSGAVASATDTVAIGAGASAGDGSGNGLGQGAIAIGASATAAKQGAIAIGKGTSVTDENAIAIGAGADSAKGALSIGVNSVASAGAVSLNGRATGGNAISIGTDSEAKTSNAVAIGYKSKAGVNAVGLGNEAFAYAEDSVAIGRASTVNPLSGIGSVAIGTDNTVSAKNTFVLGANVNATVENSVILGSQSTLDKVNTGVNNTQVKFVDEQNNSQTKSYEFDFAGQPNAAKGAVSVGQKGGERQIQYVAAGRVTQDSTDAINGSQLYSVLSEVARIEDQVGDAGAWNITTNNGSKTEIKGDKNTVGFNDGKNTKVTQTARADGSGVDIAVDLADQIQLSDSGSVTIGGTTINKDGLTINGGPSLTVNGIDAGNKTITNVAPGEKGTDAVNLNQLNEAKYDGWNIKGQNAAGTAVNEKIEKNETVEFASTSKNVSLTTSATADGAKVEIDLSNNLDLTTSGSVKVGGTLLDSTGLVLQNGPSVTTAGIDAGSKVIKNVAAGKELTDAVNVGQLKDQGFVFTSSNAVGSKEQKIKGDDTLDITTSGQGSNLIANQSDGKVEFALADQIKLTNAGSVVIGNTSLNSGGLTIQNGPSVTTSGISAGSKVITNVAKGVNGTDAVNVDQLKESSYGSWNLSTKDGTQTAINSGNTVEFLGDQNIAVKQTQKKNDKGEIIGTDLSVELSKDLDLSSTGSVKIGDTLLNGGGLTIGTGPSQISLQPNNVSFGGNQLKNVAEGTALTDAVNLGQLQKSLDGVGQWTVAGTDSKGDDVSQVIKGGTVEFAAGKNINVNTEATKDGGAKITVELAKDIDITDGSLKAGDVYINKDGISAGNNKVTNVADGLIAKDSKDAVNGGQIHDLLIDIEDKLDNVGSWNITGTDKDGKAVDQLVSTGSKVDFSAGSQNITVTTNGDGKNADVIVDLAKDLSVDSIKIGDTVNIDKNGINAGNTIITNVAAGKSPTDAVNVSQLDKTNTTVTNYFGGGSSYDPTTQEFTAPTYNVAGGTYHNVGDALGAVDNRINNVYNYVDNVKKEMNAGIASAMAMETAPFVAGKYSYAAATAYHGGEGALGLTLRKTADNGRWSLSGGVAAGTEGDPSVRVGISGIID